MSSFHGPIVIELDAVLASKAAPRRSFGYPISYPDGYPLGGVGLSAARRVGCDGLVAYRGGQPDDGATPSGHVQVSTNCPLAEETGGIEGYA